MRHLVIAAAWVEADTPDEATKKVSKAFPGIKGTGAACSYPEATYSRPDFQRELRALQLEEALPPRRP